MSTPHDFNWDKDTWKTLDAYFSQGGVLTQHQIDSYNDMVDFVIPQLIEKNNPVMIASNFSKINNDFLRKLTIKFGQIYLSKPLIHEKNDVIKPLLPNEARLRGLTYASPMFIDVEYTIENFEESAKLPHVAIQPVKTVKISKIPFMKLPVMLHSKYCHLSDCTESSLAELGECEYDQGGYFIVNGGEKVIISQERVAENQVYVWNPPKIPIKGFTHEAEVKSSIDQRFYPIKTNKVKLTKESSDQAIKKANEKGMIYGRTFHVQVPYFREEIPLFIVFKALGVGTEKEMFEMIMPDMDTIGSNYINLLMPSVETARMATFVMDGGKESTVKTQEDALTYMAERLNMKFDDAFKKSHAKCQVKYVMDIISRELFPHIGQMTPYIGQTFRKKAFFLGYMTRKLMDCYFGIRPYNDRDHYGNKRVDTSGPLLTQLFRNHFIKLLSDIRNQILPLLSTDVSKIDTQLSKIIKGCNIDSKIKYGLSTGNWNVQKGMSATKKGIAQVLNRLSFAGALSHIRRIQSPLERSGSKVVAPRRLHGTHFGMCCPNETPEGQQIGIVKNLSMQAIVTVQTSDYPIRIILNRLGVIDLTETIASNVACCTKIFVNGDWFGVISEDITPQLFERLKILKRHGVIVPYISIAWMIQWKEIHIQTDGGRYSRPVYVVDHTQETSKQLLIEKLYNSNKKFATDFNNGKITWTQLLAGFNNDPKTAKSTNGGVVEYLDTNETETSMIAMTYADIANNSDENSSFVNYTHCEIHPIMMMGIVASVIPFSDHNASPRNCYQCLWKEENVVMADGKLKRIADIVVGDSVITVDPITLEQKPSKVINQYVKKTDKPIVKVISLSGREIVCTDDHPILTYNGWKNAGLLTPDDLICICPQTRHENFDMVYEEYTKVTSTKLAFKIWTDVIKIKGNSIFVPVESVFPQDNVEIADITTESDNHSFITGNQICVHNSSMAKQSIGYYATNYNSRMDTMAHVLVYGHKPMVTTRASKYVLIDKLPHGDTAMLLYACYTGYNQEDSLILNKDAVDRGFFNTIYYRTYATISQKHKSVTTSTEKFTNPASEPLCKIRDKTSFHAINGDGTPRVGSVLEGDDVVIGKMLIRDGENQESECKDASERTKTNEFGTVDKVIPDSMTPVGSNNHIISHNAEGDKFIKVRVSQLRKPEIGDKFASRYSQKGTMGILIKSIDLPFTSMGLVPDIIMNPHGIPSRMTVGKLLETLLGRIAANTGQMQDATPFVAYDFDSFRKSLKDYGMDDLGNEVMYNGQTGQMFDVVFFYGPTYYQRLKHMVLDKIHSRESGPVQLLTRQPAEGRSRAGGLRIGEMERDVFIAHGIPKFLKERMYDSSDPFKVTVSKKEQTIIVANPALKLYKFNGQNIKDDEVVQIHLPFAMKLLLQELESMGIDTRLHV